MRIKAATEAKAKCAAKKDVTCSTASTKKLDKLLAKKKKTTISIKKCADETCGKVFCPKLKCKACNKGWKSVANTFKKGKLTCKGCNTCIPPKKDPICPKLKCTACKKGWMSFPQLFNHFGKVCHGCNTCIAPPPKHCPKFDANKCTKCE